MHNKRQQMNGAFFKEIADQILNYDHVLLFGPTNAKSELHNYLNKDLHFKDIRIDIESADKMSINEKGAFVKSYFEST
jgi:stalled ribosome rescue protein Dom34